MASTRVPAAVPTDASVSQFAVMIPFYRRASARPWLQAAVRGSVARVTVSRHSPLAPRYSPLLSWASGQLGPNVLFRPLHTAAVPS
jgi:hypothetical protein